MIRNKGLLSSTKLLFASLEMKFRLAEESPRSGLLSFLLESSCSDGTLSKLTGANVLAPDRFWTMTTVDLLNAGVDASSAESIIIQQSKLKSEKWDQLDALMCSLPKELFELMWRFHMPEEDYARLSVALNSHRSVCERFIPHIVAIKPKVPWTIDLWGRIIYRLARSLPGIFEPHLKDIRDTLVESSEFVASHIAMRGWCSVIVPIIGPSNALKKLFCDADMNQALVRVAKHATDADSVFLLARVVGVIASGDASCSESGVFCFATPELRDALLRAAEHAASSKAAQAFFSAIYELGKLSQSVIGTPEVLERLCYVQDNFSTSPDSTVWFANAVRVLIFDHHEIQEVYGRSVRICNSMIRALRFVDDAVVLHSWSATLNFLCIDATTKVFRTPEMKDELVRIHSLATTASCVQWIASVIARLCMPCDETATMYACVEVRDALIAMSRYATTSESAHSVLGALRAIIRVSQEAQELFGTEAMADFFIVSYPRLRTMDALRSWCSALSNFCRHFIPRPKFALPQIRDHLVSALLSCAYRRGNRQHVPWVAGAFANFTNDLEIAAKLFQTQKVRDVIVITLTQIGDDAKAQHFVKIPLWDRIAVRWLLGTIANIVIALDTTCAHSTAVKQRRCQMFWATPEVRDAFLAVVNIATQVDGGPLMWTRAMHAITLSHHNGARIIFGTQEIVKALLALRLYAEGYSEKVCVLCLADLASSCDPNVVKHLATPEVRDTILAVASTCETDEVAGRICGLIWNITRVVPESRKVWDTPLACTTFIALEPLVVSTRSVTRWLGALSSLAFATRPPNPMAYATTQEIWVTSTMVSVLVEIAAKKADSHDTARMVIRCLGHIIERLPKEQVSRVTTIELRDALLRMIRIAHLTPEFALSQLTLSYWLSAVSYLTCRDDAAHRSLFVASPEMCDMLLTQKHLVTTSELARRWCGAVSNLARFDDDAKKLYGCPEIRDAILCIAPLANGCPLSVQWVCAALNNCVRLKNGENSCGAKVFATDAVKECMLELRPHVTTKAGKGFWWSAAWCLSRERGDLFRELLGT